MKPQFPIVGIGASAGGLTALREFVAKIPSDSGFCYVIIQHLAPDHPSIMDQLLSTYTSLPVEKIEHGAMAEPNRIFLIPPGSILTIEDGKFCLEDRTDHGIRTPIDRFFQSLAEYAGRDAFCVILSGTGSDGTHGLREVKARGGFAIVQEQESARFPGMPNNARATGLVDFVLRPEDIPSQLLDLYQHRQEVLLESTSEQLHQKIEKVLPRILEMLRLDQGDDFSRYKTGTLIRRIERRMLMLRLSTLDGLIALLEENSEERARLRQDFLIGVTHFFRDPEVWTTLADEIRERFFEKPTDRIRIWVPGCSTGEEAYTLAILVYHEMKTRNVHRHVQIFGTDIDQPALLLARKGIFTESAIAQVPAELRSLYFAHIPDGYQVSPAIREFCVFAPHNLLQDPPYSRLDLISCRNLLIYLNSEVQSDILARFHYALNPGGIMLLGPSESLGGRDALFSEIDRSAKLYLKNDEEESRYSSLSEDIFRSGTRAVQKTQRPLGTLQLTQRTETRLEDVVNTFFLETLAKPFAVIDRDMKVRYLSDAMASFVKPESGKPTSNLDQFLMRELRLPARSVVLECLDKSAPAEQQNIVAEMDGERKLYDLMAMPIPSEPSLTILTIKDVRPQDTEAFQQGTQDRDDADRALLERELSVTRQHLSVLQTDYESTEQELRSSNEELLSMNEELQSSNEELETSREELQSINEELETINAELSENNTKLIEANSDLKNLFESTDIATLFLDSQKCLRRFTPGTRKLFGVRERDFGRPIGDLSSRIDHGVLDAGIEQVAKTLQPLEEEVEIDDTGEAYILRIRPYRTTDDRIGGCVITLFDISQRKHYERQLAENARVLKEQYAELETLYDQAPVGLSLADKDLRFLRINNRLADINGFPPEEHIGKTQGELLADIDGKVAEVQRKVMKTGVPILGMEVVGFTPADPDRERSWITDYYPISNGDEIFAVGSCVVETTESREVQRELKRSQRQLELALKADKLSVFDIDMTGVKKPADISAERITDASDSERQTAELLKMMDDETRNSFYDRLINTVSCGEPFQLILPVSLAKYESLYFEISGQCFEDLDGHPHIIGLYRDVSEEVKASEKQDMLLRELQHRVKNTLSTILAIVRFSADDVNSVQALVDTLENRLMAISQTHDILTDNSWSSTLISNLLKNEFEPYMQDDGIERLSFTGDDIRITPEQALALTLAFHELTTNAVKYGALSTESGSITVHGVAGKKGKPSYLTWEERGGPKIDPKAKRQSGFGTIMIEQILASELRGTVTREFKPTGLSCRVEIPSDREQDI